MAKRLSSAPPMTTVSVLPSCAPTLAASANETVAACPGSPAMRVASASSKTAVSRQGLNGASASTANVASASICSGPDAHITAFNMARAEANDAEPSKGTPSQEAAFTTAAHRSASAVLPFKTAVQPARTASGG